MHRLCDKGLTIATAESCTGGMLAALLTDIEGTGHGFDRGFVTYSNDAKHELLGIDRDLLDRNDASHERWRNALSNDRVRTYRLA
jgi:nicotinamide-nucleotide amidase